MTSSNKGGNQNGFTKVPNTLLQHLGNLTNTDLMVFYLICYRSHNKNWCFQSQRNMAKELNISRRSVIRAIKHLKSLHLIQEKTGPNRTLYLKPVVTPVSQPNPPSGDTNVTQVAPSCHTSGDTSVTVKKKQEEETIRRRNTPPKKNQPDTTPKPHPTAEGGLQEGSTSEVAQILQHFRNAWNKHFEPTHYLPSEGKEQLAARKLLDSVPLNQILTKIDNFFQYYKLSWIHKKNPQKKPTFSDFCLLFNEIPTHPHKQPADAPKLQIPPPKKKTPESITSTA